MDNVIAIFDIGKTNKKILLFNSQYEVVYQEEIHFNEIQDDDGFPCDDIEAIVQWIHCTIKNIQNMPEFSLVGINFSTHGATLVYLDENGQRITPLYNYLKPLSKFNIQSFYDQYQGLDEFSRCTASPSMGMLNAGVQMLWLKNTKPHYWEKVKTILHYPQYLSYTLTNCISADYTSIGAHTALWNYDKMKYHQWISDENIILPSPSVSEYPKTISINNIEIAVGQGMHDSSASLIPLLKMNTKHFILISTGTWIVCMNPFSNKPLSTQQLQNNCLCFMTPECQQIKSNMQFLGNQHDINARKMAEHFKINKTPYLKVAPDSRLIKQCINKSQHLILSTPLSFNQSCDETVFAQFNNFKTAYHQLVYEISNKVHQAIQLISDHESIPELIYISGGFSKNKLFIEYLTQLLPDQKIIMSEIQNSSALGAAMIMAKPSSK